MALQITGQAQGILSASQKAGSPASINTGWHNELLKSDLLPRYANLVLNGVVFYACTQGAIAVTNLAATATGFILSNPAGSGKNLLILEILTAQDLAAAAAIDVISVSAVTNILATATVHTTPLTVASSLIGGPSNAVGKADSSATLGATPVLIRTLFANSVSATATTSVPPFVKDEVAGAIIVAPGTAIALNSATASSFQTSMTWAELPI